MNEIYVNEDSLFEELSDHQANLNESADTIDNERKSGNIQLIDQFNSEERKSTL